MRFDECPGFKAPAGVLVPDFSTYCANCGGVMQKHRYGPNGDMTRTAAERLQPRVIHIGSTAYTTHRFIAIPDNKGCCAVCGLLRFDRSGVHTP